MPLRGSGCRNLAFQAFVKPGVLFVEGTCCHLILIPRCLFSLRQHGCALQCSAVISDTPDFGVYRIDDGFEGLCL